MKLMKPKNVFILRLFISLIRLIWENVMLFVKEKFFKDFFLFFFCFSIENFFYLQSFFLLKNNFKIYCMKKKFNNNLFYSQ
jgi:hypothetical protein